MRSLEQIRKDIGDCRRCPLHRERSNLVFGEGNADRPPIMFVGEAPGAVEDETGRPFVGPSGELLDKMIAAMGFLRTDVYITNIAQCRPPENRTPEFHEVEACRPFLEQKIVAIEPLVIVALGRPATVALLGTEQPLGDIRGKWFKWKPREPVIDDSWTDIDLEHLRKHAAKKTFFKHAAIPLLPTWHPAYLLRNPAAKPQAAADLRAVIGRLAKLGEPTRYPGALGL